MKNSPGARCRILIVSISILLLSISTCAACNDIVTDNIKLLKSRLKYNRRTRISHMDVSLRNISSSVQINGPVRVVIGRISIPSVRIANADGTTKHGRSYFEYVIGQNGLKPGETTEPRTWKFSNPRRRRFRFSVHKIICENTEPQPESLSIQIDSPEQGWITQNATISVSGSTSSENTVVTVNEIPAYTSGTAFVAENIPLSPGINTITANAAAENQQSEDNISVTRLTADLEPTQMVLTAFSIDDTSLKTQGKARVTLMNHGSGDILAPYRLILFEDVNCSGRFEADTDNRLGEAEVTGGPMADGNKNVDLSFEGTTLLRNSRLGISVDVQDTIKETDEDNNTVFTQRGGIDLSASLIKMDSSLCPESMRLSIRIGNTGDMELPAAIPVAFYDGDPLTDGTLIGTAFTRDTMLPGCAEDIALTIPSTSLDRPVVVIADDDGTGVGRLQETDETNNRSTLENTICGPLETGPDTLFGFILDATTAKALPQAQILLHHSQDGLPGIIAGQSQTDEAGRFELDSIVPGDYVLIASHNGYIDSQSTISITAGNTPTQRNLALSPVLETDQVRIVLTWNAHPGDLEAHLTGPNSNGCRHHCFYWNKEIPGAVLDTDVTDGFGPETITITRGETGTYRYYVHDFTNRYSQASALATSGARVTVYFGSGKNPQTFDVPSDPGTVWHVFNIQGDTSALTPVNRMAYQKEPGKIDFPSFTSSPPTRITWGVPYMYKPTAVDPDQDMLFFELLEAPAGMTFDPDLKTVRWPTDALQNGTHQVVLRVVDGRCGEDIQRFTVSVSHQPSAQFSIAPCSGLNPDGQITLSWSADLADSVIIEPGIGEVAESGSITLTPPQIPVAYTLTATNAMASVQHTVPHPPADLTFTKCDGVLNWNASCASHCTIDPDIGTVPCQGTMPVSPENQTAYRFTASNAFASVEIEIDPSCPPAAFGTPVQQPLCRWLPGEPITLQLGMNPDFDTCILDQGIGEIPCSGEIVLNPLEPTTYTLTASGHNGTIARQLFLPNISPPTAGFFASPPTVNPGNPATLFWDTECADTCLIDPGIGSVEPHGAIIISPDELPATYTLSAEGASESITRTVTIYPNRPVVSLNAAPALIKAGESATLIWSADYAESCSIEPGIGQVGVAGAFEVHPEQNTTYRLIAQGPGGSVSATTTVSFVKPTAQIQADRELLLPGQNAVLSWTFTNADQCTITPGIGTVHSGESITVSPTETTTYTMTAYGPGGTAYDSVTVAFNPPTVTISADPSNVGSGQETTLTWASSFATACTIFPDIGPVDANGSTIIRPTQTDTYRIEAVGPGGKATAAVTIGCLQPAIDFSASAETIDLGDFATLAWQVDHADSIDISPLGTFPASGTIPVAPTQTTRYTLTASGCGTWEREYLTVNVLCPPALTFTEPDGVNDKADTSFLIQWLDSDCDHNAAIELFVDNDDSGADGTLLVSGITEDEDHESDQYLWDTSGVPEGEYYLYARIADGQSEPLVVYGEHPIRVDHSAPPLAPVTLFPPDGGHEDRFGFSADIDGDTLAVGAPEHDQAGLNAGAVYVFKHAEGQWRLQAKITANDTCAADVFGSAVALDGDRLIVGAPGKNGTGSAYIFRCKNDAWQQQAVLSPVDSNAGYDNFGIAVALSGDMAVVGAAWSASAHLFTRQVGVWAPQQRLTAGDGAGESNFGSTVAIHGEAIIVGTRRFPMGYGTEGAYVFQPYYGQWIEEDKLMGSDAQNYDLFGHSVSMHGDSAIVGSIWGNAAYIFNRNDNGWGWSQVAKLNPADAPETHNFGASVLIEDHYAYVGADDLPRYGQSNDNAVYIFRNSDIVWTQELRLDRGDNAADVNFGKTIAEDNGTLVVAAELDLHDGTQTGQVHLFPLCSATLTVQPAAIAPGQSTTLSWSTAQADTCTIEPGIGPVTTSGTVALSPAETTTYTITAQGPYGRTTRQTTVWVGTQPPTVDLSAAAQTITNGQSTILSWNSTLAASLTIEPEVGPVAPNGTVTVSPAATTTYTITADGPGGTAQAQAEVNVITIAPELSIQAEPEVIYARQFATLSWHSDAADSVIIQPEVGVVPSIGSIQVAPENTTTYIITAQGPGGITTADVTVRVLSAPEVTLHIAPPVINSGDQATLCWSTAQADVITIAPDIGTVEGSGSLTVYPDRTTAYILEATNPAGTSLARAVVTVANAPTAAITIDDLYIDAGGTTTLHWASTHADQCEITPDIGPVAATGSIQVSPESDTQYTLTAFGAPDSASATARIYIRSTGYGNPTPAEQAHIEALNQARLNPPSEAERLGIDLNEGLAAETLSSDPVQPLACSAKLLEAARLHSLHMLQDQFIAHISPGGSTPADRLETVDYPYALQSENLAFYYDAEPMTSIDIALKAHDDLFVDSQVSDRGHRRNILNPDLREVGLGIAMGPLNPYPHAALFTCDFATSAAESRPFLLGVVFEDNNGDGMYTAGEGLGHAQILVTETGAITLTAPAGGYRIPLDPGTYQLQATLPDGRQITRTITMAERNVKADFDLLPLPVIRFTATPDHVIPGEAVELSWSITGATTCTLSPDVGPVGTTGSIAIHPEQESIYTLTATGPGGTVHKEISVSLAPPEIVLTAAPAGIAQGGTATLTWHVSGADLCRIEPDIGPVETTGSQAVSPAKSTTYTLTATGPGGATSESATVWIDTDPPIITQITPSAGSAVETVNGIFTVSVTATDNGSGICNSTLTNSREEDLSYLIQQDGDIISWSAHTSDLLVYALTLEDCAGNATTTSITFTSLDVPEDVDYGRTDSSAAERIGGGIRISNGNMAQTIKVVDFPTPNQLGFGFSVFYNSRSMLPGDLGHGWTHSYSHSLIRSLQPDGQAIIRVQDADGRAVYFSGDNPYIPLYHEKSSLVYVGGYYVWQRLDGSRCGFDDSGKLAWMTDSVGNRLELTYTAGLLATATDIATGRTLAFSYGGGLLESISGPATAAVPDGQWAAFTHNSYLNLITITYADNSRRKCFYTDPYDPNNLTRLENGEGRLLSQWDYDVEDRAIGSQLIDDTGAIVEYLDDNRVSVTDPYGMARSYRLARIGGRSRVAALEQGPAVAPYNPESAVRWTYDDQLNLVEIEYAGGTPDHPANSIQRFEDHDARGNPQTIRYASGTVDERTIQMTYHPTLNRVLYRTEASALDPQQFKETIFDYDAEDNGIPNENPGTLLYRIIHKGLTRQNDTLVNYTHATAMTYNSKGQITRIDGPMEGTGDVTIYNYDPDHSNLTSIEFPLIGTVTYAGHDAAGRPTEITDVNDVTTTLVYDSRGRVVQTMDQASGANTYRAYSDDLLVQTADADGVTRNFAYDPQTGRLEMETDHEGNTIVYGYDPCGNPTGLKRYSAANRVTPTGRSGWSYAHPDLPGRLYRSYEPAPDNDQQDVFTQYGYDLAGNINAVTDPTGQTTTYVFDSFNRPVQIIAPDDSTTRMTYDRHGNIATVTDGAGRTTTYQHDDMDRRIAETSEDTGTITYEYNAAGNLTRSEDGRGVSTTFTPDALGRTRQINYPAFDGQPGYAVTYSYDEGLGGSGRLTGMNDDSGTTVWDYSRYDDQGILNKISTIEGYNYTMQTTRTPGGRIIQRTDPSGRTIDYDRAMCACSVSTITTTMDGETVSLLSDIAFRPFGRPTAMAMGSPGSINVINRYDAAGRLIAANPGTIHSRHYTHDPNGNTIGIQMPTSPLHNQQVQYDRLNRITTHLGPFGIGSFKYDPAGNRTHESDNGIEHTYHYTDGTHQLERIDTTVGDPVSFSYDSNGNTSSAGDRIFTYNQGNRLVRVDNDEGFIAQYTYNGLGQRAIKTTAAGTTHYHYAMDGKLIAETPPGNVGAHGKSYLYNGNVLLAQADMESGTIHTVHTNYLGAVHQLSDPNGTITWEALYKPFGEAIVNPGSTTTTPWRLPGQYHDSETGLHYNYYRYYDPTTARYLTPDPIGLAGGINRYAYVQNNPLNLIDPYGLTDDFVRALTGQDSRSFLTNALEVDAHKVELYNKNIIRIRRDNKIITHITEKQADILENIRDAVDSIPYTDAGPIDILIWMTARIIDFQITNLRKSENMSRNTYIEYLNTPLKTPMYEMYKSFNTIHSCD